MCLKFLLCAGEYRNDIMRIVKIVSLPQAVPVNSVITSLYLYSKSTSFIVFSGGIICISFM